MGQLRVAGAYFTKKHINQRLDDITAKLHGKVYERFFTRDTCLVYAD